MEYRQGFTADQLRKKYRLGRDHLRRTKRQILRSATKPKLAIEYWAYRKAIKNRDWHSARDRALSLSQLAVSIFDRRLIVEMMLALERLDCFEESARLRLAWRELLPDGLTGHWRGEDLSASTLLIDFTDKDEQGLGLTCRGVSLVAKAAKLARRVTVVVAPRRVPI